MPQQREQSRPALVIIYSDRARHNHALIARLRSEGFQLAISESLETFITLYGRRSPDIIVIRSYSKPNEVVKVMRYLSTRGVNVSMVPTFLLVKRGVACFLTPLLEIGLEDMLDVDEVMDTLIDKIKKARDKLGLGVVSTDKPNKRQSGAEGSLSDMSLVDLLQALGPGQRTTRITLRPDEPSADPLLIYLLRGNIIYAKLGNFVGEKAIYRALGWENGTWVLEPIAEDNLPEPNNILPNEFILMEGCRLLDEAAREVAAGEPEAKRK